MTKEELIKKAKTLNILVVGDIMIDRYLYGEVRRRSPEADVPVVFHNKTINSLGGAGNVALNFKSLGSKVGILSVVGSDTEGVKLKKKLKEANIDDFLVVDSSRPTTVKTRIINDHEHILRVDFESQEDISPEFEEKFLNLYSNLLKSRNYNIIILQDYNKGLLTKRVITQLIEEGRNRGCFIAVDPKFDNFWEFKNVHLFKPNLKECYVALEDEFSDIRKAQSDILKVKKRLCCNQVIMTMSGEGILSANENNKTHHSMADEIEVVDVCGAGDAVLSIVSILAYFDFPIEDIGQIGNMVGTQVCMKTGVVTIDFEQLEL